MSKRSKLNFGQRMKLLREQRRKELLDKEFSLKFPPQPSLQARIGEFLVIPPTNVPTPPMPEGYAPQGEVIKVIQEPQSALERTIQHMRDQANKLQ